MAKSSHVRALDTSSDMGEASNKPKPGKSQEDKERSFRKFASVRTSKILDAFDNLADLAQNPKQYSYTDEQRDAIFARIEEAYRRCHEKFHSAPGEAAKKQRTFQL